MLIKKTEFWGNALVYGVGFLCLRAISFLLLPLYSNLLSPLVAGYVFILYTLLAFLNTLYSHGMDSSLLKFYSPDKAQKVISTSVLYSILYGVPLSCLLFFSSKYITSFFSSVNHLTQQFFCLCIISILMCDLISSRCMNILRLLEKPYYYLMVSLFNVTGSILANIYFIYYLNLGFSGAVLSLTVIAFLQLFLLLPLVFSYCRISLFDCQLLKQMLHFSLPFLPASVFFIFIELSDRWMLGWLGSVADVGLYGVGYKIGSIVLLVVTAFNLNWQPYYLKDPNVDKKELFEKIGTLFILILILSVYFKLLLGGRCFLVYSGRLLF